jgi:anti-sigma-K factor RskA
MSAPTYTRPPQATRGGVDIRLPWWALALPVLAFVALFLLILEPADAHAAAEQPAVANLLERLEQLAAR